MNSREQTDVDDVGKVVVEVTKGDSVLFQQRVDEFLAEAATDPSSLARLINELTAFALKIMNFKDAIEGNTAIDFVHEALAKVLCRTRKSVSNTVRSTLFGAVRSLIYHARKRENEIAKRTKDQRDALERKANGRGFSGQHRPHR